jgi:hypothetical protein
MNRAGKIAAYMGWLCLSVFIMWVPANEAFDQIRLDMKVKERDRIALRLAKDTAYWTAYYTWVSREGAER